MEVEVEVEYSERSRLGCLERTHKIGIDFIFLITFVNDLLQKLQKIDI